MRTRAWFVGLFLILLSGLLCVGQSSSPWSWGPVLGAIGEDYVAISWMTTRPMSIDLSYALAEVYDATGTWQETLTFDRHEGHGEIWLPRLSAGSIYRYQLTAFEGDAVYPSRVSTFRTIDPGIRAFSFFVYGETRSFPDRHKLVADMMEEDSGDASFVVHAGSLIESDSPERMANFFWAAGELARSHSLLSVIDPVLAGSETYYDAMALPPGGGQSNEQWWSLDYGSTHLIGLDSTLSGPGQAATIQEQLAWLRSDLAAAAGKVILVVCSVPLYSADYPGGKNEALTALWEPLFLEHGVRVVFSGGPARYEHLYVRGIHHIVSGGGGAPLAESPASLAPGTVFARSGLLHYIRITVADSALRVEAVPVAFFAGEDMVLSPSGRPIDSFVIR